MAFPDRLSFLDEECGMDASHMMTKARGIRVERQHVSGVRLRWWLAGISLREGPDSRKPSMEKQEPHVARKANADFTSIGVEVTDRIGWLTLNRPARRNALSPDMLDEIVSCLRSWSQGTSVSVVVIGGEGPAFCSGLDRDWIGSDSEDDRRAIQFASSAFHRELFGLRIPTIAMIHGFALGTGMDVAVLCDMRVASDDAVFGHPEIFQGGPPLFTPLRSVIGDGWARDRVSPVA